MEKRSLRFLSITVFLFAAAFLGIQLSMSALPAYAAEISDSSEVTEDGFEYVIVSEEEKTAEITGYSGGPVNNPIIPGTIGEYTVTQIGKNAFYDCKNLTGELTLPSGLKSIGADAFAFCPNLTGKLTLPEGLISVGDEAFWGCSGLTGYLRFPDSLEWQNVGKNAFGSGFWFADYKTAMAFRLSESRPFGGVYLSDGGLQADNSLLSWKILDETVARIDSSGVITAVSPGKTSLEVTTWDGSTLQLLIKVLPDSSVGYDNVAPAISSINFQRSVTKPGVVKFSTDLREDDTGVKSIRLMFQNNSNSSGGHLFEISLEDDPKYTGSYDFPVTVSSDTESGNYQLIDITVEDMAGNSAYYSSYRGGCWYYRDDGIDYEWDLNVNGGDHSLQITGEDDNDIEFEYSINNPNITSRLESMAEGKKAIVTYTSVNHIVKKEWFDAIKGKDKTLVLADDGVQWKFNGKDIGDTKDIDCRISVSPIYLEEFGFREGSLALDFASNGQLPGKAAIRIKSDYIYNMYRLTGKLYLYYMTEDDSIQLEDEADYILDGTENWCEFDLTHNSRFALSGEKLSSLKLNRSVLELTKGKKQKLTVTASSSSLKKNLKWTSSNNKVASVDSKGNVRAVGFGKATIKVTNTKKKISAACKVTVGYSITYKLNGGTNHAENPGVFYRKTVKLKSPSKKGSLFKGWYTDSKFKNKIVKINKNCTQNQVLYAKWEKITVGSVSVKSLTNAESKAFTVQYKKAKGAARYEILYGTDRSLKEDGITVDTKELSKTIGNLEQNQTYYVKVRGYQKDSTGKKVYGKYSSVKEVRIAK